MSDRSTCSVQLHTGFVEAHTKRSWFSLSTDGFYAFYYTEETLEKWCKTGFFYQYKMSDETQICFARGPCFLPRIHEWPMTFHKAWQETMYLATEWKREVVHMLIPRHSTMGSGLYCGVACSCRWSICVSATAGSCVSCGIISDRKSWNKKEEHCQETVNNEMQWTTWDLDTKRETSLNPYPANVENMVSS